MNWNNKYYRFAIAAAIVTFILQVILAISFDPYLASALTPFYAVWVMVFVIGWRKQHPRR